MGVKLTRTFFLASLTAKQPRAAFHYEFCCSFPQNAHTLHVLERSIFIGILFRLLRFSGLDVTTTLSWLGTEVVHKSKDTNFTFGLWWNVCAHVFCSCVRIFAQIINYYLMSLSFKFQKDLIFLWGDIALFVTLYDLEVKILDFFILN